MDRSITMKMTTALESDHHPASNHRVLRCLLLGFDVEAAQELRNLGDALSGMQVRIYSRNTEDLDPDMLPDGFYDCVAVATENHSETVMQDLLTLAEALPREKQLLLWAWPLAPENLPVLYQAGFSEVLVRSRDSLQDLATAMFGSSTGQLRPAYDNHGAEAPLVVLDAHDRPAYANAAARALDSAQLQQALQTASSQRWSYGAASLPGFCEVQGADQPWVIQGKQIRVGRRDVSVLRIRSSGRQRIADAYRSLSQSDPLTGLPNRSAFLADTRKLLQSEARDSAPWSLLLVNLDHTAQLNQALGVGTGDRLIRQTGHRIRSGVRDSDQVYHLGGDSFAVLIPEAVDHPAVRRCAEKLMSSCSEPLDLERQWVTPKISIGIAGPPQDGSEPVALLRAADRAMQRVKRGGGGRFAYADTRLDQNEGQHWQMLNDLHHAVRNQEFKLVFQPELTPDGQQIIGAEALLRWQDREGQAHAPAQFVPVLERSGLIVPLGNWVLRQSCDFVQRRHADGQPQLKISVNLSPIQFLAPDLVQQVRRVLSETGTQAEVLDLEITEGVLLDQAEASRRQLHALADLGVNLWLDDFGTGYSSIAYLKELPLKGLKIDRSFVQGLGSDPRDEAVVRATVDLARGFGLSVIAEGVETAGQARHLQSIGVERLQGFLFSPGVSADQFAQLRPQPAMTELH